MAEKKSYLSSSPIFAALNNIVPIRRSASTMRNTQSSFQGFLRFMDVEVKNLEGIKLPKKRKLNEIANINVASTFGRPGNLLSSLASGALDAAGLLGNMFGGGRGSKSAKPPKVVPSKGPMVKLGGLKALGVANAIFAGLDFATGLAEGESAGKAAAGAGGALAGSMLGGIIGQSLIPIPGLGFVVGSMAGNFLGGFMADRGYEAATGENTSVKEKTKERLKQQAEKQKAQSIAAGGTLSMTEVMNKFDSVVARFENYASGAQMVQVASGQEVASRGDVKDPADPASGGGGGQGKTVVIAYGTNDYSSPQVVEKNTELMVKTAKNKGYNVVVVPPNPVAYKDAYEASVRGAQSGGASIESAKYDPKDPLHLEMSEASRIRGKYNDAEFIGDSNAVRIAGGGDVAGKRVVGARGTAVLQFIGRLPKAPTVTPGGSGSGANLATTAAKMKGFSSAAAPRGGRDGCVWAVNKVFAAAGIKTPWGTSNYVPDAEKAMIKAGWQQVPENQRQAGDVYISYDRGSPPQCHIGIVLANGNILSNSSTGAKFSWEGSPADYYAEYKGVKGKFYRMPGGGVQIQKTGANSSDITATANAIKPKPQQQTQTGAGTPMATATTQQPPQPANPVSAVPMQNVMAGPTPSAQLNYPMQYEVYPVYNMGQSSLTIVPMMIDSGSGGSQRPMVVSSGGGGGGTVIMPPTPQGVLLNSLFKSMLLTNLSAM